MYQNQNRLNRYREQANGYHGEKDEGRGKIGYGIRGINYCE